MTGLGQNRWLQDLAPGIVSAESLIIMIIIIRSCYDFQWHMKCSDVSWIAGPKEGSSVPFSVCPMTGENHPEWCVHK